MHTEHSKRKKRQAGISLIEVVAVTALAAAVIASTAYMTLQNQVHRSQDNAANSVRQVGIAVENYAAKYAYEIREGTLPVPGVAVPSQPTIAELVAIGMLPSGFNPASLPGGTMRTVIERIPAGCAVEQCDIGWLSYAPQPILRGATGIPDEAGAGRIVKAIGPAAGYSPVENPGIFKGYNDTWGYGVANPTNQAAVVAVRGGYGSSVMAKFLRIDGGNKMAANLDFGGHDIIDAKNATLDGSIVVGKSASVGREIVAGAYIKPSSSGEYAVTGQACFDGNGAIRSTASGDILSCKGGRWTSNETHPGWNIAQNGCDRYIYGPPNADIFITATDASDINGLIDVNADGQPVRLSASGLFHFRAAEAGAQSGYIEVWSPTVGSSRPVAGLATFCSNPNGS